jgi:hypothetical protein
MASRHVIKRDMIGTKYADCLTIECVNLYNTEYKKATGYCKPCEDKRRRDEKSKVS